MQEMDDLLPYTISDNQRQLIETIKHYGTIADATKALGRNLRTVMRVLEKLRHKRDLRSVTLDSGRQVIAPESRYIKGTSELYDAQTGDQRLVWVKTDTSKERMDELFKESILALCDEIPRLQPIKSTRVESNDLMHLIPIGDPHIGMYAWAEEAGDDFDVEIARRDLLAGVTMVLDAAPSCSECVVVNLGDFFHADTFENKTMRSGHSLDVDSRWSKVSRLGMHIMRDVIDLARAKHKKVRVVCLPGNHDDHTGAMMSTAMDLLFSKDKRVSVCNSPAPYRYHRWGKNLFGFTHGDKCKPNVLGELMAHDRASDWGDTVYRYWHTGHIHSNNSMDCRGWRWESHRTLAAQDAWASGSAYRSGRDIKGILYHSEYGEVSRSTMDIRAIRGKR
jgi:hypothetical protein